MFGDLLRNRGDTFHHLWNREVPLDIVAVVGQTLDATPMEAHARASGNSVELDQGHALLMLVPNAIAKLAPVMEQLVLHLAKGGPSLGVEPSDREDIALQAPQQAMRMLPCRHNPPRPVLGQDNLICIS